MKPEWNRLLIYNSKLPSKFVIDYDINLVCSKLRVLPNVPNKEIIFMDLNVVTLVGRVVRDAEMRQAGETVVTNFSIAVSDGYGEKAKTSFFDIDVWGKQAEAITKYLVKGTPVGVSGKLVQQTYKNKEGENRSVVKVTASNIQLLGSKKAETSETKSTKSEFNVASDDLPF